MRVGYIPVAKAALLGEHTPDTENTLVKRTPSDAKRLMLGVIMVESPNEGITGLMSSATSQTIFGIEPFPSLCSCFSGSDAKQAVQNSRFNRII